MELPRYETQIVTLPVVTPARRRSLPNRLGPWPIKRTRSEADRVNVPLADYSDGNFEKLSLKTVLSRLDEECAAIDNILIKDSDGNTLVEADPLDDKEKYAVSKQPVNTSAFNLLAGLLAFAIAITFVATPFMTFTFANADWGKIYLSEQAPSKLAFAILLSMPTVAIGFGLSIAALALLSLKYNWSLARQQRIAGAAVSLSLFMGAFLTVWVLIWVMPLINHD